jgi:4-hydroxybenzoate polyprenyltransferase
LMPRVIRDLIRSCRPKDWVKNVFVLAPVIFSESFRLKAFTATGLAAGCFCLWSSAIYLLNDVIDAEADRSHPRKRHRPIAAGRIAPAAAVGLALTLIGMGFAVAALALPRPLLLFGMLYLGNSLAYCLWLKHRVIVDVLVIGIGFVIRLLAGCAAVGVEPSAWLVVCGFSLALVLGFGKRRTEVANLEGASEYRLPLRVYDTQKLDTLLGIGCSVCLLSYMLYTIDPETIRLHGTRYLIYTVPLVAYGLFRFVFKVQEGKGDGPVEILTGDRVFALDGLL